MCCGDGALSAACEAYYLRSLHGVQVANLGDFEYPIRWSCCSSRWLCLPVLSHAWLVRKVGGLLRVGFGWPKCEQR